MSWSYVQGAAGIQSGATITIVLPFPTVSGDMIIVSSGNFGSVNITSITDSQGNTYTRQLTNNPNSTDIDIWTGPVTAAGSTTITVHGPNFGSAIADVFRGVPPIAIDGTGVSNANASSSAASSGNLAVTVGDLVYGAVGASFLTTYTPSSGYTIGQSVAYSSGANMGTAGEYCLAAPSSPQDPGFTLGSAGGWSMGAIAIKSVLAPGPPTTNLLLWLKADAGVFKDTAGTTPAADGDLVALWKDQSGHGNDVSQATSGNRPTYKANIVNHEPVVRFDGVATRGLGTAAAVTPALGAGDFWAAVVVNCASVSGYPTPLAIGTYSPAFYTGHTGSADFYLGGDHQFSQAFNALTWYLSEFARIGGTVKYWQGSGGASPALDPTTFAIGSSIASASISVGNDAGGDSINGDIAEILLYNASLSSVDQASLESYLIAKYWPPPPILNYRDVGALQTGGLDVGALQSQAPVVPNLRATRVSARVLVPGGSPVAASAADATLQSDRASASRARHATASDATFSVDVAATHAAPARAADAWQVTDSAQAMSRHSKPVAAADAVTWIDLAQAVVKYGYLSATADDSWQTTDLATVTRVTTAAAADSWATADLATAGRARAASAADSWATADVARSNHFLPAPAADSWATVDAAVAVRVGLGAADAWRTSDRADASVRLSTGEVLPGGDQPIGLRRVLYGPVSATWPFTYAESADGLVLMANGVDPVLAWDGLAEVAWAAGLAPPAGAVMISAEGNGPLTGRRYAFARFVNAAGEVSNFGQWGDPVDLGRDGFVQAVDYTPGGPVILTSAAHALATGDVVTIAGVDAREARGVSGVDGTYAVTVLDPDRFSLDGLHLGGGTYGALGVWRKGSALVAYDNLPLPSDPRVVRRQVLRNLEGNTDVFYVDIDTDDLTSTTLYSSRTDEDLATSLAVSLQFEDLEPDAHRHDPPPSHKRALVAYAGRIWAAADAVETTGAVAVAFDSPVVQGLGTSWTAQMAGRLLYVDGATSAVAIVQVLVPQQLLVLEVGYPGQSDPLASYAIRPAPIERRLVYFSEPNLPQSWPPWNAFAVPETSDEITAMFALKGFLFIAKERHLYKFTYRQEPSKDGFVFPTGERGCVNPRCWATAEGVAYLLDENGIYSFDGDAITPLSQDQPIFIPDPDLTYRIDWQADRTLWSCVHDPMRARILWFVDFVGIPARQMAIGYDYHSGAWWLERYPEEIDSAALASVGGYRQAVVGTTGRRACSIAQGTLDIVSEGASGTLRGVAAGGDATTLHDPAARFPANLVGVPVVLVSGTGAGQAGIVVSSTADTLTTWRPWAVAPDATTVYQIGGIDWTWRGSWRRIVDDEASNPRDLEFVFQPTAQPSTLNARIYYDHSGVPAAWAFPWDGDGITLREGDSQFTVDTQVPRGYAIFRTSGHRDAYGYGHRYQALEVEGVQGADPQRLFELVINGCE